MKGEPMSDFAKDANVPTNDCISRQAAIDEIRKCRFVVDAIERIKGLPSAQPERKKGKWIPVTGIYKVTDEQFPNTHIEWVNATEPDEIDGVRCSECGTVYDFIEARNWCSECGARMGTDQKVD